MCLVCGARLPTKSPACCGREASSLDIAQLITRNPQACDLFLKARAGGYPVRYPDHAGRNHSSGAGGHRGGAAPRASGLESRRRLPTTLSRESPPCTGSKPLSVRASPLSLGTQSEPRSAAPYSPTQPLAHSFYSLGCLTAALPDGIRFMQHGHAAYDRKLRK